MNRPLRLNQSGLTMVELLIALTLTAAISTMLVGFGVDKLKQSALQTSEYNLLSNAETGLNRVANDIRLATSADDNNRWQDDHAPGAPSNLLSWTSDSDTIVLAVAAEDNDRNVIFDDELNYVSAKNNIIYYLQGTTLYRRTLANDNPDNRAVTTCPASAVSSSCPADAVVLENVTSFSVQYHGIDGSTADPTDARSVQLSVTLSKHQYGRDVHASYTTRMVFRNG